VIVVCDNPGANDADTSSTSEANPRRAGRHAPEEDG